jgi:hypothetical protein
MEVERREDKTKSVRQPSLAAGPERRRRERKLEDAGVFCQPDVSIQYQSIAKRSVLRGNHVAPTGTSAATSRSAMSTVNQFRGSSQSTASQQTAATRL